ncbi:MAG: hypothetical protein QUS33_08395 [Dehalococcoidia bacterium]|nr:hypothetical protein [Dehalococcoidia bacterium]
MATYRGIRMAPALVTGPGARPSFGAESLGSTPGSGPPHALALMPVYNLKRSSRPMMYPPFVVRLVHPSSLVRYPIFPATD